MSRAETGSGPVPAPLVPRVAGFMIDQVLVFLAVEIPLLLAGYSVEALVSPGRTRTYSFLAMMGVVFVYHTLAEWWTGQTIGKRLFGVRAVSDDGRPLGFQGSVLRNALRLVDGLGYWSVAMAIILVRGDGKRLGDVVGGTLVVAESHETDGFAVEEWQEHAVDPRKNRE